MKSTTPVVPIEIAVSPGDSEGPDIVYVMASDSNIYCLAVGKTTKWVKLPSLTEQLAT